jgi:hypothetical protein
MNKCFNFKIYKQKLAERETWFKAAANLKLYSSC